jgi:plasmid stabilization system protein ParE
VTYGVRLTREAREDLDHLYDFLLECDLGAAERALVAIERALNLLAFSPFSCRKSLLQKNPRWRELLIPFWHSGYVALFAIEDDHTVTVTAIRHQREEDYH